jgi:hypothetical protein
MPILGQLCRWMRHGADTKVRGLFFEMRRGPSHLCARNASEALENFVRHPEKTFSTVLTHIGISEAGREFSGGRIGFDASSGNCRLKG